MYKTLKLRMIKSAGVEFVLIRDRPFHSYNMYLILTSQYKLNHLKESVCHKSFPEFSVIKNNDGGHHTDAVETGQPGAVCPKLCVKDIIHLNCKRQRNV